VSKVITKEMSIIDIVENHPNTIEVFQRYGMGCIGCMASRFENVEQGALAHGIDVDSLIKDLNRTDDIYYKL
jgi:hybrid cluster-associated redox disulfide protein